MEKDVTTGAGTTVTRYAYDMWNPAKAGALGTSGSDIWAVLNGSSSLTTRELQGDGIDDHLAYTTGGGNAFWFLSDHLGSIRTVVDSTGAAVNSYTYDAFGNVTSPSSPTMYAWTGRELDAETRMQYNRAHYYDPTTGRWISLDPMGFDAGDSNLYRYVNNRPSTAIDPTGLQDYYRRQQGSLSQWEIDFLYEFLHSPSGPLSGVIAKPDGLDGVAKPFAGYQLALVRSLEKSSFSNKGFWMTPLAFKLVKPADQSDIAADKNNGGVILGETAGTFTATTQNKKQVDIGANRITQYWWLLSVPAAKTAPAHKITGLPETAFGVPFGTSADMYYGYKLSAADYASASFSFSFRAYYVDGVSAANAIFNAFAPNPKAMADNALRINAKFDIDAFKKTIGTDAFKKTNPKAKIYGPLSFNIHVAWTAGKDAKFDFPA